MVRQANADHKPLRKIMLSVGIPKEVKVGEHRVALTPNGVRTLTADKIKVYLEKNAGVLSGFSDDDYRRSGAEILETGAEVWKKADLIKKVKEPVSSEFSNFQPRHIIFTYLHLASPAERALIDAFQKSKATGIAYETIEVNGEFPLLAPMSEIAGVLAAYFAGIFKQKIKIKNGEIHGLNEVKSAMIDLAGRYPEIPKGFEIGGVLILGGGFVGKEAARTAALMGNQVAVSELSAKRREKLKKEFDLENLSVRLVDPKDKSYQDVLNSSDVIIAAVHVGGKRAPIILDSEALKNLSGKKIIIDVSIDQGGNVAGSRPSDYENPIYLDPFRHLRFSVTNIPSLCGNGASRALERVSLAYTRALAEGLEPALRRYPELKTGLNILKGEVVHPAVREAHFPRD